MMSRETDSHHNEAVDKPRDRQPQERLHRLKLFLLVLRLQLLSQSRYQVVRQLSLPQREGELPDSFVCFRLWRLSGSNSVHDHLYAIVYRFAS